LYLDNDQAGRLALRRAERLFEIIQFMRRKDVARASDLSDALEVSERTIYRDIRDLVASGVPIEGEAGVGYVLRAGFDLPPLMFSEQEIETLVLGARIV
jgi:predicted DNA-binding transcriptional regulator YafY